MERFGIDIGGSGIKGAPVDITTGRLLAERRRFETPQPATPEAVTATVTQLVADFGWTGPVGATFPAIVRSGVIRSAANVDQGWIGVDAAERFAAAISRGSRAAGGSFRPPGRGRGIET